MASLTCAGASVAFTDEATVLSRPLTFLLCETASRVDLATAARDVLCSKLGHTPRRATSSWAVVCFLR